MTNDRPETRRRTRRGWWFHQVRRALGRLHGAESGATLTEFVVVLPIFIIIFVGIMRFTTLQSTIVQLQMASTKGLWEKAMPVQHQPTPNQRYTDPGVASTRSENNVTAASANRSFSDGIDQDMAQGMARGLAAESAAAVADSGAETYATLQDLPPSTSTVTDDVGDIVRRSGTPPPYAMRMVDDEQGQISMSPRDARPPLRGMNLSPDKSGNETNAAYAAGIRYGLVQDDRKAPSAALDGIPGISGNDLHVGFNTLVAPYPLVQDGNNQHFRPVGLTRRYMRDHGAFNQVFGID